MTSGIIAVQRVSCAGLGLTPLRAEARAEYNAMNTPTKGRKQPMDAEAACAPVRGFAIIVDASLGKWWCTLEMPILGFCLARMFAE